MCNNIFMYIVGWEEVIMSSILALCFVWMDLRCVYIYISMCVCVNDVSMNVDYMVLQP